MTFDEIIIGSGLASLGVVLGLPTNKRVLVVGGPAPGQFGYYGGTLTKVSSYLGFGGLGTYWHGGIPTGGKKQRFTDTSAEHFQKVLQHFYPNTEVRERLGESWLFVPWQPIRPKAEWPRLKAQRADGLEMLHETVTRISTGAADVSVHTANTVVRGRRVWVCAGALHTPGLLDRSLDLKVSRPFVSDHVFCYLGRIDRAGVKVATPRVQQTRDGIWFERRYDDRDRALYMLRPARFAFRRLDAAIEGRSEFGRPTGNALTNVIRGASLGLFAEAIYNRSGLFPGARIQSVYAQITVPDAHAFSSADSQISTRKDVVRTFVDDVRASPPWTEMQASKRPDIFIPSTHLHHSVDVPALVRAGVNGPQSRLQVVDASAMEDIGPDHHTFKLMVSGFERARELSQAG